MGPRGDLIRRVVACSVKRGVRQEVYGIRWGNLQIFIRG